MIKVELNYKEYDYIRDALDQYFDILKDEGDKKKIREVESVESKLINAYNESKM